MLRPITDIADVKSKTGRLIGRAVVCTPYNQIGTAYPCKVTVKAVSEGLGLRSEASIADISARTSQKVLE